MTVQFLAAWNGYEQFQVATLAPAEEARLVAAGICASYRQSRSLAAVMQDPSTGALAAGGTALTRLAPVLPTRGQVLLSDIRAAAVAGAAAVTVTDVTRQARDGELLRGVRIQATGGTNCSVDFDFAASTVPGGRIGVLAFADPNATGLDLNATLMISDGAAFTNYFQRSGLTADARDWVYWAPGDAAGNSPSKWSVGGGAPVWGTTSFSRMRLRLDYSAGQLPWVELFEVSNADDTVSQIAISIDDGYDSAYTIGAPELEKRDLRGSFGIIADLVGQSGYMTLAQLQDLVARGHEMVIHGPLGGAGSLLNYANSSSRYQDVYNDVAFHQAYLRRNGLDVNGSASIYVLPQGQDRFAAGDETIRNALADLGIVGARRAGPGLQVKRALRGRGSYTLPIIGHVWTSAGAEPGNITSIVQSINAAAADRWDACLMFHKFVNGASNDSLQIDVANFRTILDAVAANRAAKTQTPVSLTSLIYGLAGKSQPVGLGVV